MNILKYILAFPAYLSSRIVMLLIPAINDEQAGWTYVEGYYFGVVFYAILAMILYVKFS